MFVSPKEPFPTCFTLRIYHGGCFKFYSGRAYCGGKTSIIDMVDIETFSNRELNEMVHDLGHTNKEIMFYNFKVLDNNLDIGFHALSCDDDVCDTQNVANGFFLDMFPHHVGTSSDTQNVVKRLFLDMLPHEEPQGSDQISMFSELPLQYTRFSEIPTQESRVDAIQDVNHMEVYSSVKVEKSWAEVNDKVVVDSERVEESYDDVALIGWMMTIMMPDEAFSAYIDSRLENIDQFLNDLDDDSDNGEVLNELEEYGNAWKLFRKKVINSFDRDDLAFQCMIGFRKFVAYFDPFIPMNIITRKAYNTIMVYGVESTVVNLVAIARDVYVFVGSFTYVTNFVVLEDIGDFILRDMAEVVMGKPFREVTKLEYDCAKGLMSFTRIFDNYTFQMLRTVPRLKS
ncbi:hypothetical protein Tco_1556784 [Tanacetum coccineum]